MTPNQQVKQGKQERLRDAPAGPLFSGEQDERDRRLANVLTYLASEGVPERDRDWIELTGKRQETEVGRTVRQAKWIKDASDWLKGHGWSGLTPGGRPKCYLLLFWKSADPRIQLKQRPKDVLSWEMSGGPDAKSAILLCTVVSNLSRLASGRSGVMDLVCKGMAGESPDSVQWT